MLVELHVVDLGIVADLDLVLGPGLTAITGETGAGQDAPRRGGRAARRRPRRRRAGARRRGRSARRGALRRSPTPARRPCSPGWSRATVAAARTSTGASPPRASSPTSRRATRRPARPARAPVAARAGGAARRARPLRGHRRARRAGRATAPLAPPARVVDDEPSRRSAATRVRGPGRSTSCASRSRRSPARTARRSRRGRRARSRGGRCSPTPPRTGKRSTDAYAALEGPALDALGAAARRRSTAARRSPSSPIACCAAAGRGGRRRARAAPRGRRPSSTTRSGSTSSAPGATSCASCGRKYGDTLADVIAYAPPTAARLAELEGYEARAAELEARAAAASRPRTIGRRHRCSRGPPAARRRPLPRAVEEHLRELAMPHAGMEVTVEPGEPTEDGADRVTFLLAPNPGETARPWPGPRPVASSPVRCWRRAWCSPQAPPTLVFDEVDAGIGGEAGLAVGRLLAALGSRAPGAVRHAPRAGGGVRRHAGRGGEGRGAESGERQRRRGNGGAHGRARAAWSTGTRGSPSCRACSPVSATRRTPAEHAAELLARPRPSARGRADGVSCDAVATPEVPEADAGARARVDRTHEGPDPSPPAG